MSHTFAYFRLICIESITSHTKIRIARIEDSRSIFDHSAVLFAVGIKSFIISCI